MEVDGGGGKDKKKADGKNEHPCGFYSHGGYDDVAYHFLYLPPLWANLKPWK